MAASLLASVCTSSRSPYCTAAAASSDGVLRRQAEHHRDVAELEVAVDEHDRFGRALRHRGRHVDRDAGLAHAALRREHRDQPARLAAYGTRREPASRFVRAGEQLTDPVDRLVQARLAADHDCVAGTGAERLLQHVGRELVHREHDAERRVRARHPVHVLEADGTGEPGPEHRHDRRGRVEPLDQVLHRLELRGARELDREARAQVSRRARRRRRRRPTSRPGRRPWRRTPRRLLAARGSLGGTRRRHGRVRRQEHEVDLATLVGVDHLQRLVLRHLEGEHARVRRAPARRVVRRRRGRRPAAPRSRRRPPAPSRARGCSRCAPSRRRRLRPWRRCSRGRRERSGWRRRGRRRRSPSPRRGPRS